MAALGQIREIGVIKETLNRLKNVNLISSWSLPCEAILSRLDAATFFVDLENIEDVDKVNAKLNCVCRCEIKKNEDKQLSGFLWQVKFKHSVYNNLH